MTIKMIRIDDSYEDKLTSFVLENAEHMEIINDTNLEYDAYFYERKEQLDNIITAIDNGNMHMYSEDEFNTKMKNLEEKLIQHYAD